MAKYSHDEALVEEYIDLEPVLDELQIDKEQFLAPIQKVEVARDVAGGRYSPHGAD